MKFLSKLISVLFLLIITTSSVYSQYLVKLTQKASETNLLLWYYEIRNNYFAAVENISELENRNINYKILHEDIETGKFFWIESKSGSDLDLVMISSDNNLKILWNDISLALVKVKNVNLFTKNISTSYEIKRVNFRTKQNQHIGYPEIDLFMKDNSKKGIINAIIDSVRIDEIIYTEEHLTGETSFWLNGQLDSIQTRYSLSPQIHKAKDYLQSRFEDYGYTVEYLPFRLGMTFRDIQFSNSNSDYGWLITIDKIFGTSDRGNSWAVQYEGTSGGELWSVFAYSQNLAFAVGEYSIILRTTDGQSWQQMASPTSVDLFGIHFKSDTLGWICGDLGYIFKTTTGGTSWARKTTPSFDRLYDLTFINDSTGWAVGNNGVIIHTSNYGESWILQTTPTSNRLYGVYFKDEYEGFAVGWDGTILHTTNGGTSWSILSVPNNGPFYDIDFSDQNTGMIIGGNITCMVTTNGGATWASAGNSFNRHITGLDLIDTSEAWVSGHNTVAQSIDFGTNWTDKLDSIPIDPLINLIATKTGTTYPDQHYIVCAHYDAVSNNPMVRAPGADDNGSGTATVLEAARVLANHDFKYSIKFVLFPGEEQGMDGSEAYAANASATGEQIQGVLNMDMIAYDGNGDGLIEIYPGNMASSQAIGSFLVSNISAFGLALTTEYITSYSLVGDHSSFWAYGFPAILQTEDFQDSTPYYHTSNDLISTLNLPYFHENAKLNIGTVALLAEIDSSVNSVPVNEIYPDNFVLEDPYPNPFNPTTNIEYYLPTSTEIEITLFNTLGQRVMDVYKGEQNKGLHNIVVDGKGLSSGVYIYRLKSEKYCKSKKCLLIK